MFLDDAIIGIQNVNHYYGKGHLRKQVLFDVNAVVRPGEVVILMGPSGSGKTTLLTLMGALRSTQEGSMRVLGEELHHAHEETLVDLRRHIGYIFQAHNLLKSLTARQNVLMSMELHPQIPPYKAREMADHILEAVGLADHMHNYPEHLSGGQKQRVAICRALVSQPKLVLADEPTAALDSKSGRDVVEIMRDLAKQQGSAVMLVTHDNRILDVADRILYMEDGRLTAFNAEDHPFVTGTAHPLLAKAEGLIPQPLPTETKPLPDGDSLD
jgi:putative ABC transport system ATP-binding protein